MNPEYIDALRLVTEWVKANIPDDIAPREGAEILGAVNKLYLCVTDENHTDALERIQEYAYSIMHDQLEGQDELDPAWIWRTAHDALFPCTCLHSTWGGEHSSDCPRFSDKYKVR